jgi:phosphoribosylformylglycinamidine (FGAM) synthase-like amidotransferase family enzyme
MSAIEGQDLGGGTATVTMEQVEPLDASQAEMYDGAFKAFQEARQNLEALLIAGGFSNKDIVRAEFQGDNPHFVTRPSANGHSG